MIVATDTKAQTVVEETDQFVVLDDGTRIDKNESGEAPGPAVEFPLTQEEPAFIDLVKDAGWPLGLTK